MLAVGLINPVIADVAVSVVPREQSGMAAGINDTFRQVGVAVGIAVWGAVFVARGAERVSELAAGTPVGGRRAPRDGSSRRPRRATSTACWPPCRPTCGRPSRMPRRRASSPG